MLTFLFWNLGKKPLAERLASLVAHYEVDILVLAECAIPASEMLMALNRAQPEFYFAGDSLCDKVRVYTRFLTDFIPLKREASRWTIRHLRLPARQELILAAAHLPSKLYWQTGSQSWECAELAREIRGVEEETACVSMVLVGDFNMNPFESGVVSAHGLHAVMTRALAWRMQRTVLNRPYPFFYNPMRNCFGDATAGPPGTYFYERAEHELLFWHMFDQVLLRPALLPYFNNDELRILSDDGAASLLTRRGVPNKAQASDHLPVLFKLRL